MMKAIQKSSENTNTKTKTMTKTTTKTKTQKKCLKHPTYAIFLKSWWLTHSKYDDRYLTLVILFTPVTLMTLITLFQSYIQFYRAECITVSGFFLLQFVLHILLTGTSSCDEKQMQQKCGFSSRWTYFYYIWKEPFVSVYSACKRKDVWILRREQGSNWK